MKVESNAQNKQYKVNWLIDWAVFNVSINTVQVIWETVLVLHEVNSTTMEPFQNVTTYHVDLEVWSSHQILLILCACNVWEDVIKRVWNDTFLLSIALNTCHQWNAAAQHMAVASATVIHYQLTTHKMLVDDSNVQYDNLTSDDIDQQLHHVPKKTCDHIFYNNFNNKCPITIIFGIVSSKSMSHRKLVSFPTSPI